MGKNLLFAVLLVLFTAPVIAQQHALIDSLKNELRYAKGELRTEMLYDLAWEYRKSNPDSTLYYCREIIEILRVDTDNSCLAKCYNFMGLAYHYKGDDVQAFEFYNRAIDSSMDAGDSLQYAHSLNNLGRMFLDQGDFVKSYDHAQRALQTFRDIEDIEGMSYAFKSLGEIYQTQLKYDRALVVLQHALRIRNQSDNISGQISTLNEIALIFRNMNMPDSALYYYQQAEEKAIIIGDDISLARMYLGISELQRKQEDYSLALEKALNAQKIAMKSANISLMNDINIELAQNYYMLDDLPRAKEYSQRVISGSEKSKDLELDREAYRILAKIYEKQGQYDNALHAFQMFSAIRDNLNNSEAARTIERLEARIDIESKEKENQLLMVEKRADQAIIDRQRLQNILLTVAVLTALFFLVMLYMINSRRKKTNAELRMKNLHIAQQREEIKLRNDQIADQNTKLRKRNEKLAALNNEKDTLMSILAHDLKAPFNRVHGIGHLLEMSKLDEDQKTYVKMLFGASENGLNLIRDLLEVSAHQEEKSVNISKVHLKEALQKKMDMFRSEARSKDIKFSLDACEELELETDEPYLGRILDNLISNAIKFSEPGSTVRLATGIEKDSIYLSVSDDGPGFTEEDKKMLYRKFSKLSARPTAGESSNGLGLAIVKLLVETLEGEIELITQPGEGSTFIIRFPVTANQQVEQ